MALSWWPLSGLDHVEVAHPVGAVGFDLHGDVRYETFTPCLDGDCGSHIIVLGPIGAVAREFIIVWAFQAPYEHAIEWFGTNCIDPDCFF